MKITFYAIYKIQTLSNSTAEDQGKENWEHVIKKKKTILQFLTLNRKQIMGPVCSLFPSEEEEKTDNLDLLAFLLCLKTPLCAKPLPLSSSQETYALFCCDRLLRKSATKPRKTSLCKSRHDIFWWAHQRFIMSGLQACQHIERGLPRYVHLNARRTASFQG